MTKFDKLHTLSALCSLHYALQHDATHISQLLLASTNIVGLISATKLACSDYLQCGHSKIQACKFVITR